MGTMLGDFGLRVIRGPPAAFGGSPPLQGGECSAPLATGDGREAAGGSPNYTKSEISLLLFHRRPLLRQNDSADDGDKQQDGRNFKRQQIRRIQGGADLLGIARNGNRRRHCRRKYE